MKKNPRILVADDMQMTRRVLKSALVRAGLNDITEVENGEELLLKMKADTFDLIICDWDMPKLSGIDALRAIRGDEAYKDMPFVMVTAMTDKEYVKTAIEAGINDYITKPIKPELFIKKVKSLLIQLQLLPATA